MSRLLVVQHERSTGPGWWEGWLAAAGVVLDVVHPYAAQELPTPAGLRTYDGLLVLGGAMGPLDDADCPWLPPTRELLAETLGEHVFDFFLRNKRREWEEYRVQVSAFERDRMLPVV